jgi:hypothetical protein
MTEADALTQINNAYRDFYRKTGIRPTRIYLGHTNMDDLRRSAVAYQCLRINEPIIPMEVMGMQVFEVCAYDHFYVC